MIATSVILGAPGCGKTRRCLDLLGRELEAGVPPERIAFVAFTKAAAQEAQGRVCQRFRLDRLQTPWVRTIHSAAFQLLELEPHRVMADVHWTEFGELHGYQFSRQVTDPHQAMWGLPNGKPGDRLRSAYDWGRNCRVTAERVAARFPGDPVDPAQLRVFVERLESFKRERGLLDFCDFMLEVLDGNLAPDVDVLFIDEGQDLAPLQIAVVEMWCESAERVYVAGDDDQALFSFQGADPAWLVGLAGENDTETLEQSYRVPELPHALAQRIIGENRARVPKEYLPAAGPGTLRRQPLIDALELAAGSTSAFVLVRNRRFIRGIATDLMGRGVPFVVEGQGGMSPLSDPRLVTAVRAVHRLLRFGESLRAHELDALFDFVPSKGLLPRGTKARVKEALEREQVFNPEDLRDVLGLGGLIREARGTPLGVLKRLPEQTRQYLERLVVDGHLPEPCVTVTTIHGSKGREAELVVVVPDMTRITHRAYLAGSRAEREAENRVWYVAVTRTLKDLVLADPITRRAFDFPVLPRVHARGTSCG